MKSSIIVMLSFISMSTMANTPYNEQYGVEVSYKELRDSDIEGKQYMLNTKMRSRFEGFIYRASVSQAQFDHNDINLVESGVIMQPEFKANEVLMLNTETGIYGLDTDSGITEYHAYGKAGLIGVFFNDKLRLNVDYKYYFGDEYSNVFGESYEKQVTLEYKAITNFSIGLSAGSIGDYQTTGLHLKGVF